MLAIARRSMHDATAEFDAGSTTVSILAASTSRHTKRMSETHTRRFHEATAAAEAAMGKLRDAQATGRLMDAWRAMRQMLRRARS